MCCHCALLVCAECSMTLSSCAVSLCARCPLWQRRAECYTSSCGVQSSSVNSLVEYLHTSLALLFAYSPLCWEKPLKRIQSGLFHMLLCRSSHVSAKSLVRSRTLQVLYMHCTTIFILLSCFRGKSGRKLHCKDLGLGTHPAKWRHRVPVHVFFDSMLFWNSLKYKNVMSFLREHEFLLGHDKPM